MVDTIVSVMPLDCIRYINAPDVDDTLYCLLVAIPGYHALEVVELIEVDLLGVALILDYLNILLVELVELLNALICSKHGRCSADLIALAYVSQFNQTSIPLLELLVTECKEYSALISVWVSVAQLSISSYGLWVIHFDTSLTLPVSVVVQHTIRCLDCHCLVVHSCSD